ncbi:MAG: hypothetical protein K6F27_04800 [Ruminococcus sp.]|nr:hypothetical protein [Ruminococcus sp.]MBQ1903962.1 hypothetical protein [Ruminococcus sp.]MCR5479163.1 hypothetical protein [Ruminococcus sp.]
MYTDIKLEKGLYSITGKTFTQALAELDPDSAYENTELKGLDAFERQLKRFDIKVKGANSDRVEKFFLSTQSAVLFPEYVRRAIKAGLNAASILPQVAATTTYTDSMDFRGLTVTSDGESDVVAQCGELPVTTVKLAASSSALTKFARKLSCSYESVRKQRLEAFGVILRNLGAAIARDVNGLCMAQITSGITPSHIAGDEITYADLAAFWSSMSEFNMTTMVCKPETMAKILGLEQMKYCVGDYMTSGMVKTPYGVTLVKCSQLESDVAVGIDNSCAVEAVFGTDVVVDFDKLISTQCSEIACSVTVGFSKLTDGAVKVLDTDPS